MMNLRSLLAPKRAVKQSFRIQQSNSEAIAIYIHECLVRQLIVHPDGNRCITASGTLVNMFALHSGEHIRDFQRIDAHILDAALFDRETLMAYTNVGGIVFWSLSNGNISLRCNRTNAKYILDCPVSIFSLCPNQFMVIDNQKKMFATSAEATAYMLRNPSPEVPAADSATLRVVSTCKLPELTTVFSHRNSCAVSISGKEAVQVWAWEADKFQCTKVFDVGFSVTTLALSDEYMMCADDLYIYIYNSSTMDFMRKLKSPLPKPDLVKICIDKILIRSPYGNVAILDIDSEEVLWKTTLGIELERCQLSISKEFGAHLIVATEEHKVLHLSLPPDTASKLLVSDASAVKALPPLQKALSRCLAGEASPADYCNSLITFSACRVSFPEWCSAHQLLVLAVRNGDVVECTEHNGSIAHWFENLYLAVQGLELTSTEDLVVAKRYLREAKRMGLIEGIEPVLTALHVTSQVREEVRALHRAGILIFEQVLRIEKRLDLLKESCEQYRKYQLYSQCIGIALQIIPIVGGASAGLISAGVSIVDGLSVKDVADYAFGLGSSLTEGELSSLGDRIFGRAAEVLSPESVVKMKQEELRLVERAVSPCGLSVEELRRIFIERSQESYKTSSGEDTFLNDKELVSSEQSDVRRATDICGEENTIRNEIKTGRFHDEDTDTVPQVSEAEDPVREKGCFQISASKNPSELQSFALESTVIQNLDQREIATLWAAFIFRFDDSSIDSFLELRDRILAVLEANELDGGVLVDRDVISSGELGKAIVDGLNSDGKGAVTIGATVKVKQFINAII